MGMNVFRQFCFLFFFVSFEFNCVIVSHIGDVCKADIFASFGFVCLEFSEYLTSLQHSPESPSQLHPHS